ncbi:MULTISPECIES: hypothetical protein [unclassified Curtobacterium]|uniref:hypothetical protein n=1 Tax=unclassified Curtobacterium TaxID=257496 RepID=UPI001FB502C7|nr:MULTISPECIES: hypothetical protein [unclassified Curtobacterium]
MREQAQFHPPRLVLVQFRGTVDLWTPELQRTRTYSRHEVSRGNGAIHWYVEQVADARIKARLLTQLALTRFAEALAFLDPAAREHTVVTTVLQPIDDEQALVSDDDGADSLARGSPRWRVLALTSGAQVSGRCACDALCSSNLSTWCDPVTERC